MTCKPSSADHLGLLLSQGSTRNEKIDSIDLSALNRIIEYTPEDMTVTVETGILLDQLQTALAEHGQWLPVDAPNAARLSIADLLNKNCSGPRRYACGTVRDYLIGLKFMLADGTPTYSGGKVVKNVAGYDLARLFIGSSGTLGVPIEASFKLRPLPESERFVQKRCSSLAEVDATLESVIASPITPIVLDLHNLNNTFSIVLGFAGTREEVDWQLVKASELHFQEPASLDYELQFWNDDAPAQRISVLPSKLVETIRPFSDVPFVARAGNGVVYHRGQSAERDPSLPLNLIQRVKDIFDPNHVFPSLPL